MDSAVLRISFSQIHLDLLGINETSRDSINYDQLMWIIPLLIEAWMLEANETTKEETGRALPGQRNFAIQG